ncbi:hypothetical protein, partial [Mariprofundus sp. EBB-1]|uniref:hypothetical protein n=1 Tax=Mariprofundus sp. EBB-1 TaxID=2650971 RepID=UPI00137AEBC6
TPNLGCSEEIPNYCIDHETNITWLSILGNNQRDNDIAKLFALRIGLCELVTRKIIPIERATVIFEQEREGVVTKKKVDRELELRRSEPQG